MAEGLATLAYGRRSGHSGLWPKVWPLWPVAKGQATLAYGRSTAPAPAPASSPHLHPITHQPTSTVLVGDRSKDVSPPSPLPPKP